MLQNFRSLRCSYLPTLIRQIAEEGLSGGRRGTASSRVVLGEEPTKLAPSWSTLVEGALVRALSSLLSTHSLEVCAAALSTGSWRSRSSGLA